MDTPRFEVYATGLLAASVCTSLPAAEVARFSNQAHPTWTGVRWTVSADPSFADGRPNPAPCDLRPGTHTHYLLTL